MSYSATQKEVLPKGWKRVRLGEVVKVIGGGTPATSVPAYWNGNIPWLTVSDFNSPKKYVVNASKHISKEGLLNSNGHLLENNDIIISARGTVGVTAVVTRKMAFNQSNYGIRSSKKVVGDYLFYLLRNSAKRLLDLAHGAVFKTITRDTLHNLPILLPPLPEQQRIAAVLDTWSEAITTTQALIQQLELRNKGLLQRCLDPHFWSPHALPDLPRVPLNNWRQVRLGEVAEINPKEPLRKNQYAKKVSMASLSPWTKKIEKKSIEAYQGGVKFRNGDTIFARITPCLENGKTAFVDILEKNEIGFGSTEFIVFRGKDTLLRSHYLFYLSTSVFFRKRAICSMVGTSSRRRVQAGQIKNISVPLPPLFLQTRIAALLDQAQEEVQLHRQLLAHYQTQQRALMQQLLTGHVRL